MKKQILLYLSLFLSAQLGIAQITTLKWAKQQGGSSTDQVKALATDISGNIFSAGIFSGTANFNPSEPNFNLTSAGNYDGFVSKFDINGDFVWAIKIGGIDSDYVHDIAADDFGNIYVSGAFQGTVDFDPSAGTENLTALGSLDGFVAKYNGDGELIWVKQIGGTSQQDTYSIKVDEQGNAFVVGAFYGTVDFDPGTGTHDLTAQQDFDGFVLKLNNDGDFVWVKHLEGDSEIAAVDVQLDDNQNIYVTGYFGGSVNFDLGISDTIMTSNVGFNDAFLLKLDETNAFVWAKQINGTDNVYGSSISIDGNNSVYIVGDFKGVAEFDTLVGSVSLTSSGNSDGYLAKYNSVGGLEWAKQIGSTDKVAARSVIATIEDQVYVTGSFGSTADFNVGGTANTITSNGLEDVYIAQYDTSGTFIDANAFGSIGGNDAGFSVIVGLHGLVYLGGEFEQDVDFNPGTGTTSFTSFGVKDGFVMKLGSCDTRRIDVQTACGPFEWINGVIYTEIEYEAMDTIVNAEGCDSIITLNLDMYDHKVSTETFTGCESFTLDNVVYTTSQTLRDTISGATANGCDSIKVTEIVINDLPDVTTTLVNSVITANLSGASYQWIDCDNGNAIIIGEVESSLITMQDGSYAVIVNDGNCSDTSACVTIETAGLNNEMVSFSDVKIFPNPTSSQFTVAVKNVNSGYSLELLDALGKVVKSQIIKSNSVNVNMAGYHKGVYFVRVSNEFETATYRVIKQ